MNMEEISGIKFIFSQLKLICTLGMVAHSCDVSTWEAVGSKFEISLGYIGRLCLKRMKGRKERRKKRRKEGRKKERKRFNIYEKVRNKINLKKFLVMGKHTRTVKLLKHS
jgi:hypothetical protein